ncbi:ikaros family zinc finger protein-like [Patiria miniata]|uniref:C2H2-type domain-containing protein n=1 Tax=Patiria miniata TaxID=46514 RepID=A0A913Z847_PATMI|nr:ikaros family zinc finger protein-like [Patiria miniata]
MERRKPQQNLQYATGSSKNRLKCKVCDKTFMFPSVLMRHMRKHNSEKANKCRICKRGFPDKSSLSSHMQSHESSTQPVESDSGELAENLHMQNPLKWISPLEDNDQSSDEVGYETEPLKRPEDMATSDRTSTGSSMLPNRNQPVIDLTSTSGAMGMERPGLFQQESVNRILSPTFRQRKETLNTGERAGSVSDTQAVNTPKGHFTLCTDGRALKCNYCSFICRRTCGRMIKHLRVHGIRSRNQCKSCGLGFFSRSELQSHQNVCSQSSLAPRCPECGKTFSFRSLLRQHMNTHVNKKLFKCGECTMSFMSASLFQLHMSEQHPSPVVIGDGKKHQCSICPEHFESREDLDRHLRVHVVDKPFQCTICSKRFSSSTAWFNHIRIVHRVNPRTNEKDETLLQSHQVRPTATSAIPVSSPVMTMPIVVSVSSQSKVIHSTYTKAVDKPSLTHSKSVNEPSELTAGSPEMIDDTLHAGTSGLVFMRKELNPEATDSDSSVRGPSVVRSWSVSDSSDPMASTESAGVQVGDSSRFSSGSHLLYLKKEVTKDEIVHPSTLGISRLAVEPGSTNQGEEGLPAHRSHQQLEPTSTAADREVMSPREVFPVHIQHCNSQFTARSSDNPQRFLDVGNVMGSPSPEGSYGKSTDDITNPESPCRATSTRRSLDVSDTIPGSHHCNFCDIAFGDPIMHYLHMGWHVTGDPWKCNGCGQECGGKVDFFLHLYKAGHN